MVLFWIFWGIDAIVALIFLYFFCVGIGDGSVLSFNIVLWLVILGVLAAVMIGTLMLKSVDKLMAAKVLAGALAIPALLVFLFFIILIGSGTKWN